MVKKTHNSSKQTQQFKLEDITLFGPDDEGNLRQLCRMGGRVIVEQATKVTLKLDNKKNG